MQKNSDLSNISIKLASLANEFAAEDRDLAEQGMGDYSDLLDREERQ